MSKILFIDDDEGTVQVYGDALKEHFSDHEVVVFSNALEAHEYIEKNSPVDLLITDMAMGGAVGGEHIIEQALKVNCDVQTLIASGLSSEGMAATVDHMRDRFNLSNEQITGLAKPFRVNDLIQKIENWLDGHNEMRPTNELGRQVDAIVKGEDDSGSAFDLLMGS